MLGHDAFLRRLPQILDSEQRIRLEALVFSADTIDVSYAAIVALTSKYAESITNITRTDRIRLFANVWTIVDQLHSCRQLCSSLGFETQLIRSFTGARAPLFGVLSYIVIPDSDREIVGAEVKVSGGGIALIAAGTLSHAQSMGSVNPAGRMLSLPVSGFQFEAFDQLLKLDEAVEDTERVIGDLNKRIEEEIKDSARLIAEARGIPIEKLLAHFGADLALYLAFKIPESD